MLLQRKIHNLYGLLILAIFIAGCSKNKDDERMELVHAFMSDEMEPAAEGVWDAAGWVITEEGEEELWPTTDEGWQDVADSAQKIADAARELKSPPYTTEEGDWNEIADGLVVAADRAKAAAEGRDKQELFDAGGHMYRVCVACHQRYMTEDHPEMTEEENF